jgi:hypothetical protein
MSTATTPGREPVLIVEIEWDQCTLTYGSAPCAAVLGTTGPAKCYNTRATCQDGANYARGTFTQRYCRPQDGVPLSWGCIPSLLSVSTVPTILNPGGGDRNSGPFGNRATVRAVFKDHPHSGAGVDPYRAERISGAAQASGIGHDPFERGTYWTKQLARAPYWINRKITVYEGYSGQALASMPKRVYFITDISGPTEQGRVVVKAEDVLGQASRKNALAPAKTEGVLRDDISDAATSFVVVDYRNASDYPTGGGTVRIGDELIQYAAASVNATLGEITFTGLTRGSDRTEASDHDADDNVQICLRYTNEACWDVAYDLLVNYAGMDPSFINLPAWTAEGEQWLRTFRVTTLIVEPEGVEDLAGELMEQCLFFIWWCECGQEIKFSAFRPPFEAVTDIDDYRNIKEGSWSYQRDMGQRISQLWIYYGVKDWLGSLNDPLNFNTSRVRINPSLEADDFYGQPQVRRIYSRWLVGGSQALVLGARLMQRYQDGALYFNVSVDAKEKPLWTGDSVRAINRGKVDFDGNPEQTLWQIISAEETQPGETVAYKMLRFQFDGRYGQIMPNTAPVYGSASDLEKAAGAFFAENDASNFPDGTEPYRFV